MEGLIPSIGGFLFSILLLITYYTKQRFDSIKNKLFRFMLIFCVLLTITDFLAFCTLKYSNFEFLILFVYRMDWFVGFIWYLFFYLYSMCFLQNIEATNIIELIRQNKKLRNFTIFFVVLCFIYMFIPIVNLDRNNITWLPQYISYFVISSVVFIVFLIIFPTLFYKDVLKKNKMILWIMIIELFSFLAIQLLNPNISFAPMAMVLQTYFLFFNVENPDLKIIKETEKLKNDIERSSNAKIDFLSNMSHEIKSPMNAIIGFTDDILNSEDIDIDSVKSDIVNISNAGNNLLDIINNILDISKIETGVEEVYLKEYSLSNMIIELSNIIKTRIYNKKLEFILDIQSDIPDKLYGDSTKIYQVLLNILSNAVKYTEVGKVKLSVTGDVDNDIIKLHFRVSDTGYGIKKEDYDKLFAKFSRLDSAKSNEIEGTGLGLVITKKYVDLMNGKIWFDSEYQVGTTFYVDIEQKIIDGTPIGNINQNKKENDTFDYLDCSKYNILIVDDNKLNIKVASRILQRYNFNIETCDSGKNCINEVKSGKHYDMIFLDHMMPEMDGIQTLHIIRKLEDYEIPPIVALTANAITGMKEMYLKEGFDEYLSKPINIADLDKLVNKYFNRKEK